MKKYLLLSALMLPLLPAAADNPEYRDGVFFVNEDWYGHQNSTVNWISDDWEWSYRIFQQANPGKELGCTNQYGQIYGGKFYLIAKQEKDPGASIKGGRITVADARTMQCLFQSDLIDPSGNQCDGRGCLGIDEHKLYISTSNGVWIFDTDNYKVTGMVEGTANPNGSDGKPNTDPSGSLYHGQCGSMVRVGNRVFVAHQSEGLLVVDPYTDKVTDVLTMKPVYDLLPDPGNAKEKKMPGIGSVVLAKDGSLWVSVARDIQGTGATLPYLMRVDPYSLATSIIEVPDGYFPPSNSWYAWTPDGFCASTQNNVLYWNGGSNSWFSGAKVFKYDIDKNEFSKIIDLDKEAEEQGLDSKTRWNIYGCSMRVHPVTDRLYISLFHNFQNPTYKLRVTDADGKSIKEVDMISNYWFPSLPVFPDNYAPQAHDPGIMYVSCLAPTRIPVKGLFTDLDTMESAIVVSVTGVSDSDVFSAEVINGDIVTTPLDIRDGESGAIYLKANSNGEIADMTLDVRFSSSGIDDFASDLEEASYYSIDGQKLYSRPSAPGIYILHTPAGSSHKFFIH
ncbi:MAG: DUF5074 domain-containing protein [Bacteroidales bacterium]|nr:DUF5074 domain-containing protein [Bacteroidales bacterium]